ncbi:type II toxin-antitoxin system VapC family toxin [Conchiformibius kuhniae]|uniref:Type II toxin-antitoxin system VapC family toxin n=1 Tax=Conchiformibius kuhniae TaxID=211502 RepID=A0A8T9MW19_9NEIS|nr:type II toxin-antitoxin system VapC family toxin [Conchiformibius kuhniae]UOP05334.1 type II toxin-antitoxin system VapC family toxin [Conchiformibius kuhniae]
MSKYLLDTCFILGLYNQNEQAIKLMRNVPFAECCVSVVNRIELLGYHDITPCDEQELTAFLSQVRHLEMDKPVQNKAVELRKRHKIKLADNIVLATALVHGLTLLTLDNGLNNKFLIERER